MTVAMIVDDETHVADYMAAKLSLLWPELEVAAKVHNGRDAVLAASRLQPDVVFLDIHMPGMSGLEVARALPAGCKVVFVTAFDEFAVQAFERAAVDYLLKPVSETRLLKTVQRLRELAAANPAADSGNDTLVSLLESLRPAAEPHLQWLRAGLGDTTQLVAVDEVIYFKSDQKYTGVITATAEHLLRTSIKDLEEQLDPAQFWRIHRGVIVRVEQIVSAVRDLRGRYTLKLRDSNDVLRSSTTYGHLFKHM